MFAGIIAGLGIAALVLVLIIVGIIGLIGYGIYSLIT